MEEADETQKQLETIAETMRKRVEQSNLMMDRMMGPAAEGNKAEKPSGDATDTKA